MDELDLKIMRALQVNGRKKNTELARELEVPPTTLQERLRRLEDRGIIKGYRAIFDLEKVGLAVHAFISVTLERHEVYFINAFEEGIRRIAHIRSCYHLTGRFDYLLHIAAFDLKQISRIIKDQIASIPGIGKVETFLVLSDVKTDAGWYLGDDILQGDNTRKAEVPSKNDSLANKKPDADGN